MDQGLVVAAGESGAAGAQTLKLIGCMDRQVGKHRTKVIQERGQGRKIWG